MPRTCTVCRLPAESRQEAEEALLQGEPYRGVARRFGASPSAMLRHKDAHLSAKLAKAERVEVLSAETLLDRVLRFQREAEAILADARAGKRDGAALGAIARLTELLKVEGAAIQAAQVARQSAAQGCERCERVSAMSRDETLDFLNRHIALDYLDDPAGFLERLRNRAAVEISERRRILVAEARTVVDAAEKAATGTVRTPNA